MKKTLALGTLCTLIISVVGCGDSDYYTIEDFSSVEKIDAHVHINTTDATMLDQAEEDNVRLITLNVESGRVPIEEQQDVAVQLKQDYPDRLAYTTAFSMEGWDDSEAWQEQTIDYLEESFEKGAFGVKVWKNVGMEFKDENDDFVMIDNPQFDPVFEYLSDEGIPLYGHIGEPKNCWLPLDEMTVANDRQYFEENPQYHMYQHEEYPSYEEIVEARDNMLDKNLELTFFGAHLGSMEWSIDMMAEHLDEYPNMVLGMAHRIPHLQYLAQQDREKLRDFFIEYQDRFLYSTDLQHHQDSDAEEVRELAMETWRDDWRFFVTDDSMSVWQVEGEFQGLQLPREVVDKIYRENAQKWLSGTDF